MGEIVEVERRRLHRRLRRRPHQGHARAARRRPEGRGRRIRRQLAQALPSRHEAHMTSRFAAATARSRTPMPASQHANPKSDIEIAQAAKKRPIMEIAREKLGIAPENLEPYGHYKAKVSMDYIKSLQGQAERQADPGLGDHADAGGRGQDHHHGRPHRRAQPHRQEGDAVPARAVARPVVRHEGRRGRRRLCAGRADGGHQPPFHRRLPRHHIGAQPALGADRQPHLLGQRARHRQPPRRLAARHGHERPRAALDRVARSAASPTASRARTASTSRWRRR